MTELQKWINQSQIQEAEILKLKAELEALKQSHPAPSELNEDESFDAVKAYIGKAKINPVYPFIETDDGDIFGFIYPNKIHSKKLLEFVTNAINQNLASVSLPGVERSKAREYILCAANRYFDGNPHEHQPTNLAEGYFVTCGRRHHNCIGVFAQIVGFPYNEEGHKIHLTEVQGFLTSTNRFINRKEAYKIAFEMNQIIGPNKGQSENSIGLTSEDLY